MKIGIDISQVVYGAGVSNYTRNLVSSLLALDKKNDYVLFAGALRRVGEIRAFLGQLKGNFEDKVWPISPTMADLFWNRLRILPVEYFTGKLDVFHSSDWAQPKTVAFKVTTIHDLVPLMFPSLSHPRLVNTHKWRLERVKKEVDRIVVPSYATGQDVISWGIKEKAVRVIPEAPDPIFVPAKTEEVEALKVRHGLSGKYLLAIGVTPRKNIDRIIKAYERLGLGEDLNLVVLGVSYLKFDPPKGVRFLGHVPLEELPPLYSGAEALVYPSLYEGFGLPILEAFKCKVPVITSNLGSMKEICENSGVLVDPYNVGSIVEGVKEAIRNRRILIKKGLIKVKKYSWKHTAEKTLEVYKEGRNHANWS